MSMQMVARIGLVGMSLMLSSPLMAQERRPVPVAMPTQACLSAPTQACLADAMARAVASLERDAFRDTVGARYALGPASTVVSEPALDALALRLDPRLTQARLIALREEWRARLAAAPAAEPDQAPSSAEIAATRAKAMALKDAGDRMRAMLSLMQRLARHDQLTAIVPLAKATLATLNGKTGEETRLRAYLTLSAARLLRSGGDWAGWSAMLTAGGWEGVVARATPNSGPEDDPTDSVFENLLDDGIPPEWLLRWALKAKNATYREQILGQIVESARKAGRRQEWLADFGGLRSRLIAATAKAEPLAGGDDDLLALAGREAGSRADHGLALAVKLQPLLRPGIAASPDERDQARGFVLQALAQTMTALARDKRP